MQMSPEIKTAAMWYAREMVRDCLIANHIRISWFTRAEIDEFALELIRHEPMIIQQAWDECKMRWEAKREAKR